MTTELEIQAKADELSLQHNCKVHPLVFKDLANPNGDPVVGFIREPNRMTKLRYMDKALMGSSTAGAEIIDSHLIKEASDNRIYDEKSENDVYYLGAVNALNTIITLAVEQLKKK